MDRVSSTHLQGIARCILSSDHPQVFPSQPESRKGDSELSVLSCPVLPPKVLTCPICFCPNAQPKGKTPGLPPAASSCCPVVLGRFSQAGHPASWSPDGLRPGMTPKVTTVVSRTPAENAKSAALWLSLWKCVYVCVAAGHPGEVGLVESPRVPTDRRGAGSSEEWQRPGFLPTQKCTGYHLFSPPSSSF